MNIAQKLTNRGWRVNLYDDNGRLVGRVYRSQPIIIRNETEFLRLTASLAEEGVCLL